MNIPPTTGILFTLLVSGCGGLRTTQPYAVARACAPPYDMEVRGEVKGDQGRYQQTLHEECTGQETRITATSQEERTLYGLRRYRDHEVQGPEPNRVQEYEEVGPLGYSQGRQFTTPNATFGFSFRVGGGQRWNRYSY
jgi:hypothetical protein